MFSREKRKDSSIDFVRPRFIYLGITDKCNMKCPMCITKDHRAVDSQDELNSEQIKANILVPGKKLGLKGLNIGGGEPTLSKHLLTVINDAVELNYEIFLPTNLYRLNLNLFTDLLKLLDDQAHMIQISFDSIKKEEIISIRGIDAFEAVNNNLFKLVTLKKEVESKVNLVPAIILQPDNADSIIETVDYLLYKAGVDSLNIQPRHDYSNVNKNNYMKQPFPRYPNHITKKILNAAKKLDIRRKNGEPIYLTGWGYQNWVQFYKNPLKIKRDYCASTAQIYIDAYGNYRGCLYAQPYSNVLKMDIASYLKSPYYEEFVKFVQICKICIHGCS